jgi:hypothetical protein
MENLKDERTVVFENDDLHDLDKAIQGQMSRTSLVKNIREDSKKHDKYSDQLSFMHELKEYWYIYAILFVSSLFTGTLGVYMGLSPYREGNSLIFQTDLMHIFLAAVYSIAFLSITEGAFILGKRLFYIRENANKAQIVTSWLIMLIAGLSVFLTGVAGGQVIASNIDFMTNFVAVSSAAQKWVVIAIPALLTIYTVLLTIYHLSSDKAESLRVTSELRNEKELDSHTRRNFVKLAAQEAFEQAELKVFVDLIKRGKISRDDAMSAIENGWSLERLESHLGKDLDGNGSVGSQPAKLAYAADTEEVRPN